MITGSYYNIKANVAWIAGIVNNNYEIFIFNNPL